MDVRTDAHWLDLVMCDSMDSGKMLKYFFLITILHFS